MNRPKEIKKKPESLKSWWGSLSNENSTARFLPYFLYVAVFGIIYIANIHYAERNIRRLNKIQAEVEELRTDYTSLKTEYMMIGKRSEVAKRAAAQGLIESDEPAQKIIVSGQE